MDTTALPASRSLRRMLFAASGGFTLIYDYQL
jgi:hypothetical protein